MTYYKYSLKDYAEDMARGVARDASISRKQAIMISKAIRNKDLDKAQSYLKRVLEMKQAVPFTRFSNGLGHKSGMAAGRYPQKACKVFLDLLNQVEANAQTKGLGKCRIIHVCTQQAHKPMRQGRQARVEMKRAHVEVVVKEIEEEARKRQKTSQKEIAGSAGKASSQDDGSKIAGKTPQGVNGGGSKSEGSTKSAASTKTVGSETSKTETSKTGVSAAKGSAHKNESVAKDEGAKKKSQTASSKSGDSGKSDKAQSDKHMKQPKSETTKKQAKGKDDQGLDKTRKGEHK